MPKNLINITSRLFTSFMLLIAIVSAQNMTQDNPEQRLTIRIEKQEYTTLNIHSNSHTDEVQKSYDLGDREQETDNKQ